MGILSILYLKVPNFILKMVIYTSEQAREILEKKPGSEEVEIAQNLEKKISLHVLSAPTNRILHSKYSFFIEWVTEIIGDEKISGWKTLFTAPGETKELCEAMLNDLHKVYEAENSRIVHEFRSPGTTEKFNRLLEDLNDDEFWQKEYWERISHSPNSWIVVDIDENGLPYYYIVPVSQIHSYKIEKGKLVFAAWESDENEIIWADPEKYIVFDTSTGEPVIVNVLNHGAGQTPVVPAFYKPIDENKQISGNFLWESISRLDWLLFMEVGTKYANGYAAFPIIAAYKDTQDAEFYAEEGGAYVEMNHQEHIEVSYNRPDNRPPSRQSAFMGPGTKKVVDAPQDKEQYDLMMNPVKFITISKENLEYLTDGNEKTGSSIYKRVVGVNSDLLQKEAVNEKQVQGNFESKETILTRLRDVITASRQAIYEIMGSIFSPSYNKSDVFMGDKYYVSPPEEMQAELTGAKQSGASAYVIEEMAADIDKSRYRHSPEIRRVLEIVREIEPYPGHTIAEITALKSSGVFVDPADIELKANLPRYIRRMEREYGIPIDEFGIDIEWGDRINTIEEILRGYIDLTKLIDYENKLKNDGENKMQP